MITTKHTSPTSLPSGFRPTHTTHSTHSTLLGSLLCAFLAAGTSLTAATFTWDGGGATDNWNENTNWSLDSAPPAGTSNTDLIFAEPGFSRPTSIFTTGYDITSMTFNDSIASGFTINNPAGSFTLEVDAITLDAGLAGPIFLGGRYTIGTDNTVITNNSGTIAEWEGNLTTGAGQVQLRNGDFRTTAGSPNNSVWTGGTLIDNALWDINTVNAGSQTTNFGSGDLVLGDVASTANATLRITALRAGGINRISNSLVVNSSDAVLDIDQGGAFFVEDIALTSGSNLTVSNTGTTFIDGVVSGSGDLDLGSGTGFIIMNGANTFTGNVTLNSNTQIRTSTGGLGNAANQVTLGSNAFRLFGTVDGGTITLDNNLNFNAGGGNIGVQATEELNSTGTYNGNFNLGANMAALDLVVTTTSVQNLTMNLNGAILDSNPDGTNVAITGAGTDGSVVTVNLDGANNYAGSTTINPLTATGGQLTVNLGGSLSNSNLTIGANTQFGGTGTLFFNLDGVSSDLITANGTLDITNLTLDFELVGAGATEANYLIADYSGGTLVGSTFSSIIDMPAGYSIDYNFGGADQIAIVPEPSTYGAILGMLTLGIVAIRRRR